ncbi:MAG: beta-ketoacyl synthase N-terminal-like domain-containing protein, partial [bacterium]
MSQTNNSRGRVVITGIGLVTPFGVGVEKYWQSAVAGASAVSHVAHFDPAGLPSRVIAYLNDPAGGDFLATDVEEPR